MDTLRRKKNKESIDVDGLIINYIGLHDFIANKKASGRSQDLTDIKEIEKNRKR